MKFSTMAALVALSVGVGGCASFPGSTGYLDELKVTTPGGSAFTQALSREYLAFADSEREQYDWIDSQYFAKKGLDAAHGKVVPPEALSDWSQSDPAEREALIAARLRLARMLETDAPQRLPSLTATAQVKFDCWVEQEDEGWQLDDIAACRSDFQAAMDAIETQAKPAAPAASAASAQSTDWRYSLFFDFNDTKLGADAVKTATAIAKEVRLAGYPKIRVTGYTDLSGSDSYNVKLSLRRAEAVKRALIAAGVPADRILVEGLGKTSPHVVTADGVREPQNRRVEVTLID